MRDAHQGVQRYIAERFLALSPKERLLRGFGLIEMGWKMAEIAVRREQPHLAGRPLQLAVFRWVYQKSLPASTLDAIARECV